MSRARKKVQTKADAGPRWWAARSTPVKQKNKKKFENLIGQKERRKFIIVFGGFTYLVNNSKMLGKQVQ